MSRNLQIIYSNLGLNITIVKQINYLPVLFQQPLVKGEGSGMAFLYSYNYKNVAQLARCKPHPQPLPFGKGEASWNLSLNRFCVIYQTKVKKNGII